MKSTARRALILLFILSLLVSFAAAPVCAVSPAPAAPALSAPRRFFPPSAVLTILLRTPCTRAEAAAALWYFDEQPHFGADPGFTDLDPAEKYYPAVCWAVDRGLFSGAGAGTFSPAARVTRLEILLCLWKYAGRPSAQTELAVPGYEADSEEAAALRWAAETGITDGVPGGAFLTSAVCTRGQLLLLLTNLRDLLPAKRLVVIDPGHQRKANYETEPNGPGSSVMKAKTAAGTYGSASKLSEGELNLTVSLQLREALERRGYRVLMTREHQDVNLSNIQRAKFANDAGADIVIRIHANGSTDSSVHGAETICMTRNSPFNPGLYAKSRALSDEIVNHLCARTGAKNKGVWETDTMTGINWSAVPVTIVEMGYMTNPAEDRNMASPSYQEKIVQGICDGVDAYFANNG